MPAAPPTEAVLSSLPGVALLELDADLRVLSAAGGALSASGWPATVTEGRRLEDLLPADISAVLLPRYRLALEEGRSILFDLRERRAARVWRLRAAPLPGRRVRVLAEIVQGAL